LCDILETPQSATTYRQHSFQFFSPNTNNFFFVKHLLFLLLSEHGREPNIYLERSTVAYGAVRLAAAKTSSTRINACHLSRTCGYALKYLWISRLLNLLGRRDILRFYRSAFLTIFTSDVRKEKDVPSIRYEISNSII
jgi:hypothetical protein